MALIKCPECQNSISSLSEKCNYCGLPKEYYSVSDLQTISEPKKKKASASSSANKSPSKRQFRRLPNGFGQIHTLTGNRRKPFVAFPPTKSYKLNGNSDTKPLGYFETWQDAYECLYEYNKNPYDVNKYSFTFDELYEKFINFKFPTEEDKHKSAMYYAYKGAYNKIDGIKDRNVNDVTLDELQLVINSVKTSKSANYNVKMLLKNMYEFADARNLVDKNYGSYLETTKDVEEEESGEPLTEKEIKILWKHCDNVTVQIILLLIYTGFRINELKTCKIDLEDKSFVGGLKTKSSKNRYVPMHEDIVEFAKNFRQEDFVVNRFRQERFYPIMEELGIAMSNGKKHTPHDCRHTFSWLADKYKLDNMSKRMILGHTKGKDVEDNVYGHRTKEELRTEINKIQTLKKK